ncbi:LuxR family transcriptional regulator [Indioceanicola profundi]|uniref:LuxR family transcriptional regulator n=1 Tax=Indioceanicola profundi TaxID=2220096 RepID=UPI000E6AB0DD|nr:LuxR family transcriptional regulator [Indioceanicola profundi]
MSDETGSLAKLTRREAEILALLPAGISNQAIADQLGVAEVTVKLHLRSIYRKIGVTGRPGAIRIWRLAQGRGR